MRSEELNITGTPTIKYTTTGILLSYNLWDEEILSITYKRRLKGSPLPKTAYSKSDTQNTVIDVSWLSPVSAFEAWIPSLSSLLPPSSDGNVHPPSVGGQGQVLNLTHIQWVKSNDSALVPSIVFPPSVLLCSHHNPGPQHFLSRLLKKTSFLQTYLCIVPF